MREKPNLDALRAIAILLVVLDHTCYACDHMLLGRWNAMWIGLFGVYLFFVHTCLVLMWSLERKPHTLDFYIRRVFRIYPLAIVTTLCALAIPGVDHLYGTFHHTVRGVLENMLLIQNLGRGGGYAVGVMWSLPLEVDMYVLLPVLYFFVRKNFSLWPLLLLWSLACGLARFDLYLGNHFATVIPCFLPGVMAYVIFGRTHARFPAWSLFPFLAALLIFFMHFSSVASSWPTCLALGLMLPLFRQIRFAPGKRIAHELAKYSYSIYLGHMFALELAFRGLNLHSLPLRLLVSAACIAIFSFAGYHLVEKPLIRYGARVAAKAETRYEQHQR